MGFSIWSYLEIKHYVPHRVDDYLNYLLNGILYEKSLGELLGSQYILNKTLCIFKIILTFEIKRILTF